MTTPSCCKPLIDLLAQGEQASGEMLQRACRLAEEAQSDDSRLPRSPDVARTLAGLHVDESTLIAALLCDPRLRQRLPVDRIRKEFGDKIAEMVDGVNRLNTFQEYGEQNRDDPDQKEKLRRMLLAMITDVRVMLIKLAYRLERLRNLPATADYDTRRHIARETLDLFAPLANRLGVGQLKWELEDLAFRYLEPQIYKRIAGQLEERRTERQHYIEGVTRQLNGALADANIACEISGRPKHIYSIWNKMRKKHLDFEQLFDVRAVRVYVNDVKDCYTALGIVHNLWTPVKGEFDDYIAQPKGNGYQSLHTAVYGPEGRTVEIQIRTWKMHREAEYGVAAHWRYKEGSTLDESLQQSIANLRVLLESGDGSADMDEAAEFTSEHVYVLTPDGKVIELRAGATPLDFAYSIHTEVGHGCRGAKINGRIAPLNTPLQTGDRVEILTASHGEPKRNWLNPHLGYIHSARTRAKVRSYFNQLDRQQNIDSGRQLFEREIRRLGLRKNSLEFFLAEFQPQTADEFYEAVGKGNISQSQLARAAEKLVQTETPLPAVQPSPPPGRLEKPAAGEVVIEGVGNLLTRIAPCCQPQPGDPIVGFITRGSGVKIHRQDCPNMLNLMQEQPERVISVSWGHAEGETYTTEIAISAVDRKGLLKDITGLLADDNVNLMAANTHTNRADQSVDMKLTLEISGLKQLSRIMDRIAQLPNINEVRRLSN